MDLNAGETRLFRNPGHVGKALDKIEDLRLCERPWAGIVAHQRKLHRRRPHRACGHVSRRLPTGMGDLHPQMVAVAGARFGPGTQLRHTLRLAFSRRRINCHVTRPLQHPVINHHVAGNQQPRSALGPAPIQGFMAVGSVELVVCQTFGHGCLGNAVGQDGSAGEFQRFGEGRLGHGFILMV